MPRERGTGTLRRLPSGQYGSQVMLGTDPATGKRVRVHVSAATQGELRAKRDAAKARYRAGWRPAEDVSKQPVAELLAAWLERRRGTLGYGAWQRYALAVAHLTAELGAIKAGALTTAQVAGAYRRLHKRLSATSVRYAHRTLRQALRDAVRSGGLVRDATEGLKPPRVEAVPARALSPIELARLHAAASGDGDWPVIWRLLQYSGLRSGELRALQWQDVTWPIGERPGAIRVRRTVVVDDSEAGWRIKPLPKSARGVRTVPVPAACLDSLRERFEATSPDPDGLVFPGARGAPLLGSSLTHAFARHAAAAGLVGAHPHLLRHTFASALLAKRLALPRVAALLGHSVDVLTRVYAHWLPDDDDDTPDLLLDYYGEQGETAGRSGTAGRDS